MLRTMDVCLSVCLFVCLSVCRFVCSSVCLFACLPPCLFVCLSVCLFVCLSVCLFVCLSVCRFVGLSVCRFVGLSVCRRHLAIGLFRLRILPQTHTLSHHSAHLILKSAHVGTVGNVGRGPPTGGDAEDEEADAGHAGASSLSSSSRNLNKPPEKAELSLPSLRTQVSFLPKTHSHHSHVSLTVADGSGAAAREHNNTNKSFDMLFNDVQRCSTLNLTTALTGSTHKLVFKIPDHNSKSLTRYSQSAALPMALISCTTACKSCLEVTRVFLRI